MYDKLAQASNVKVVVLNPDERVRISQHPALSLMNHVYAHSNYFSSPTVTVNQTPVPSSLSTPINQNAETEPKKSEHEKHKVLKEFLQFFHSLFILNFDIKFRRIRIKQMRMHTH